jgi:hypothetical protein
MVLSKRDYEECLEHAELSERIRKTLYYGITPGTDRPSLPVTEIAVDFLQDAAPKTLGRVDSYIVSSIGKKAGVSPCSLMLGMLYIERLKHRNPDYLQQVSSSDLFLIAMMVASKYLYDEGIEEEVFNDEWAESAKMDVEELNDLERTFLAAIDWNLFVKPEDFWQMLGEVEQRIALDKGLERGYFTYTDLDVVSQDGRLFQIIKDVARNLSKAMLVFSVAYFAGTVTLVTAPLALTFAKTGLQLSGTFQTSPVSHSRQLHSTTLDMNMNRGLASDVESKSDLLSDHHSPSLLHSVDELHLESISNRRIDAASPSNTDLPIGTDSDFQHHALLGSDNSLLFWTLSLLLPNSRPLSQHVKIKPEIQAKPRSHEEYYRHDRVLNTWRSWIDPYCEDDGPNSMANDRLQDETYGSIPVEDQYMDLTSATSEKMMLPECQKHVCCCFHSPMDSEFKDLAINRNCQNLTQERSSVSCLGKISSWALFQEDCESNGMPSNEKARRRNGPCYRIVCNNCCSCSNLGLNFQMNQAWWLEGYPTKYSGFADVAVGFGINAQSSTAMAG